METNITKREWNKDLIYSFVFVVLAWVTWWLSGSIRYILDTPLFSLPFVAKLYIGIQSLLYALGFQADPLSLVFIYGLPFLFSALAIYLAVRSGIKMPVDEGKRKFFGFILNDWRGIIPAILIIFAASNILLLWAISY